MEAGVVVAAVGDAEDAEVTWAEVADEEGAGVAGEVVAAAEGEVDVEETVSDAAGEDRRSVRRRAEVSQRSPGIRLLLIKGMEREQKKYGGRYIDLCAKCSIDISLIKTHNNMSN